jgi:hypothetical protein
MVGGGVCAVAALRAAIWLGGMQAGHVTCHLKHTRSAVEVATSDCFVCSTAAACCAAE